MTSPTTHPTQESASEESATDTGRTTARSLEIGDADLAGYVRRWRTALSDVPAEGYWALRDAITTRQANQIGVDVANWRVAGDEAFSRASELLDQIDRDGRGKVWHEPHTLGWFHQHFGQVERDAANRDHTRHEQKHLSQTVTTQLYTPRWIADFLVETGIEVTRARRPSVCDPAVGGGQMLLAALDAFVDRGVAVPEAVGQLHGLDLDARAVDAARRAVKLHVARLVGRRVESLEATIDAQIRVGDGLLGPPSNDDGAEFDVVVTNPPYMGSRSMPANLKRAIRDGFRPFHRDLYAAFVRRCHHLSADTVAVLAQQTIWFLSRFEKARHWLLDQAHLAAFMHLGAHAFANVSGEKASVAAFVQQKDPAEASATRFIDLREFDTPAAKLTAFEISRDHWTHQEPLSEFDGLPGRVLAHWLPGRLRRHFQSTRRLADIADIPGSQNKTGRNRQFVKKYGDVGPDQLRSAPEIIGPAGTAQGRWVFYSKGGRYAPWWGNWQHVVDWSDEARQFYAANRTSNLLDQTWWFEPGICYTDFGGRTFNARLMPAGCVFDMAGPAIFPHDQSLGRLALMAVLNSTPVRALLNATNPSLHYQVRDLRNLPVPEVDPDLAAELAERAGQLVDGMQLVAAFVPASPRARLSDGEDVEAAREFVAHYRQLERRLDQLVCQLYGCPELLGPAGQRPAHAYLAMSGLN